MIGKPTIKRLNEIDQKNVADYISYIIYRNTARNYYMMEPSLSKILQNILPMKR